MILATIAATDQSDRNEIADYMGIMWAYEIEKFNELMVQGTTVAVLGRTPSNETDYDNAFIVAFADGTVYPGFPQYLLDGIELWVD